MDNLTHGLAGYALARAALGHDLASVPRPKARAFMWTAVVASNLPDADLLLSSLVGERKLGYLLHHRGHTHTLLGAVALGLLVAFVCAKLCRYTPLPGERRGLLLLALGAALLHVVFDGFNNYGVHPFSPLYDGWIYGDFVFIVEPLLAFALLSYFVVSARTRLGGALGVLFSLALLALIWLGPALSMGARLSCTFLGAGFFGMHALLSPRVRLWVVLASVSLVLASFFAGSRWARAETEQLMRAHRPGERLLDVVLTPLPGNPACWNVLTVAVQEDSYVARFGLLSAAPALVRPRDCSIMPRGRPSAPLDTREQAFGAGDLWTHRYSAKLSELHALYRSSCDARALLRFVRVPYWTQHEGRVLLGDLRYDSEPGLGFAELFLRSEEAECPRFVPPWIPPRADLLEDAARR